MIVGIVGLGLIGGSLAKAYKQAEDIVVYGADVDHSILEFAKMSNAIDDFLTDDNIALCDLILIAINPDFAIKWLETNAPKIDKHTVVIDCCGTKRKICEVGFRLADEYGFEYAGGHPMAGSHQWGFKNSRPNLFRGAAMVIVPKKYDDIYLLDRIKHLLLPVGFGSLPITTAENHDRVIAFTSQLAHVVSNAYVKSPTAKEHHGFSAGSYRDLTRVAWLNPAMWTELFLENNDFMINELDSIINSLTEYRDAIAANDRETLCQLLDDGRKCKQEIDGR
ncbi:MAG: prephenate dehydrogenase [Oscillospiraceae bacterium]|nr:prephenate dehydrogenase [Oscillospiraceae bacterium]MBQ3050042.1 prephenate dehydrogenase [Oscillospiraceae bacterium]MBQ9939688.1 prephenate dehydrogenase [Oscillospiraceae bacterium]